MKPVDFDGSNTEFIKPDSMTDDECGPLRAYLGKSGEHDVVISLWQFESEEEKEIFIRTGKIRLVVFGCAMPPVSIGPIEGV